MKKLSTALVFVLLASFGIAQNVGISDQDSTFTPDASALLELKSTSKGVLVPRMTTAQRQAISNPANGLLVFDTDISNFFFYTTTWNQLGGTISTDARIDADLDTKVEVERTTDNDHIHFSTAGVDRMTINDTGTIIMGEAANHTYIEKDGSLRMVGDATTFNDLTVSVTSTRRGGAKDPDFNRLVRDASNSSHGVYGFDFDKNTEEELFFMVQLPHSYKEGSDIYPHIHWTATSDVGSSKVRWALEYTWVNVASTYPTTTTIYGEDPIAPASPVTNLLHTITPLGAIDGTGKTLSSIMMCRVYRDATHSNDNFNGDAALLMIDFHIEEDSFGSRTEYTK